MQHGYSLGYSLECPRCGMEFRDPGDLSFRCPHGCNSLIRTRYWREFHPIDLPGIWRYSCWIPISSPPNYPGAPVIYRSERLAEELDLNQLYIALHGYFPELGANIITCSFKEIEAVASLCYASQFGIKGISLASVGNTANGFLNLCQLKPIQVYMFIPLSRIPHLFCLQDPPPRNFRLIGVDGDYALAQELAIEFSRRSPGVVFEGGSRNVARRDSQAALAYIFLEKFGFLFEHYFQAVGSGLGPVAIYEGASRLLRSGFISKLPKIHFCQNYPFTPIVDSWKLGSRELCLEKYDFDPVDRIIAKMLSNKQPIYSMYGGLYDALKESGGYGYSVTNSQIEEAMRIFERKEGIDISPEAGAALSSLIQALDNGSISRNSRVMINITGAGFKRLSRDRKLHRMIPEYIVAHPEDLDQIK